MEGVKQVTARIIGAVLVPAMMAAFAADAPQAKLENGSIHLSMYLPDTQSGYYRGTRFDWSGVIPYLDYKGHSYHGKWFEEYQPTTHDAIMGPVEEFGPIGYEQVPVGGHFMKIGVGMLVKPEEKAYSPYQYYTIADAGKWTVTKKGDDQMEFRHTLQEGAYAYRYTKMVQLSKDKAEMTLFHTLENTGKQRLETTVYDHNFFMIDEAPTGPDYEVTFPYTDLSAEGARGLGELVRLDQNKLLFIRNYQEREQAFFPDLLAGKSRPYAFTVENIKTKAKVAVTSDRPVVKMVFWSNPKTVCPEPYIAVDVEPGKTFTWRITYTYDAPGNR